MIVSDLHHKQLSIKMKFVSILLLSFLIAMSVSAGDRKTIITSAVQGFCNDDLQVAKWINYEGRTIWVRALTVEKRQGGETVQFFVNVVRTSDGAQLISTGYQPGQFYKDFGSDYYEVKWGDGLDMNWLCKTLPTIVTPIALYSIRVLIEYVLEKPL